MIITKDDIDKLEEFLEEERRSFREDDDPRISAPSFFSEYPHLLMPLGFDEFHAVSIDDDEQSERKICDLGFQSLVEDGSLVFPYESFFRATDSGAWHWFEGITHYRYEKEKSIDKGKPYYVHFIGPRKSHHFQTLNSLLSKLHGLKSNPDPNPHTLLLPSVWTPKFQLEQNIELVSSIKEILKEMYLQKKELREIHWRQLEEIVAELLSSRGMEILITPRSKDGGRDIIARGELILGEPTTIAVEVKQKPVVGLFDVQRALRANEDFPSLLIATSGRFSAGVIQEKARERNRLRLFLKDEIALTQWIDLYGGKVGWRR